MYREDECAGIPRFATAPRMMGKLKPVVKKARAFVIRKNTRRITELRCKKGSEQQRLKNQRKVERLIKEIEELKDLNVDSFCEEVLQQSKDAEPAQVGFDVDTTAGKVKQKMCDTKVLQQALANHCELLGTEHGEKGSAVGKEQKSICVPNDSQSVSHCTALRKQQSRLGESSDGHGTMATEFGTPISDSEEEEEAFPMLCDSNSDEEVLVESQAKLLSRAEVEGTKGRQKATNRLGQRARQKLWLGKYGLKANHLRGERSGKPHQQKSHHLTSTQVGATVTHKSGGGANTVTRPLSQELHPSWAAKKRQKQQSSSIDGFCGKKITFSDSD